MLGKMKQDPTQPGFTFEELTEQEERYVLDSFTQKDAKRLAFLLFDIFEEYHMEFAFQIFLNGSVVFQYLPEGTGRGHAMWLDAKVKSVMTMNMSTMRLWALGEKLGNRRTPEWVPTGSTVMCGGGFPIHVKGAGIIGALACSGPGDQNDHLCCIEAMKRFTGR